VQAFALGNTLGDIRGLAVDGDQHGTGIGIEAHLGIGVADLADGLAGDLGIVDDSISGNLTGDDNHTGGHQRLAGHAGLGVLGQDRIKDRVGDLVGNLVRMTF